MKNIFTSLAIGLCVITADASLAFPLPEAQTVGEMLRNRMRENMENEMRAEQLKMLKRQNQMMENQRSE